MSKAKNLDLNGDFVQESSTRNFVKSPCLVFTQALLPTYHVYFLLFLLKSIILLYLLKFMLFSTFVDPATQLQAFSKLIELYVIFSFS